MNSSTLRLELWQGDTPIQTVQSQNKDYLLVGSAHTADLVLPATGIAPLHALVRVQQSKLLRVYDLGSDIGLFHQGKRVVEAELADDGIFWLGNSYQLRAKLNKAVDGLSHQQLLRTTSDASGPTQVIYCYQGQATEVLSLDIGQKRSLVTDIGNIQIRRRGEQIEAALPLALPYCLSSKDGKSQDGHSNVLAMTIHQSAMLSTPNGQIFICPGQRLSRLPRSQKDADQKKQRIALASSLTLAACLLLFLQFSAKQFAPQEPEPYPQTEFSRVSMNSSPPTAEPSAAAGAPSASPLSQSIAKLLGSAPGAAAKVSANGNTTIRGISTPKGAFSQEALASGISGAGANQEQGLSQSLSKSGASAGGKSGFGNGTAAGSGGPTAAGAAGGYGQSFGSDEAEAIGGLDKALIAAVVQANIGQIRQCYERQLLIDNNLGGKVVASWTIDGSGKVAVTGIKNTTLHSRPVEDCIQAKIKAWQFPQPKGGGKVLVSYPFLLKSLS